MNEPQANGLDGTAIKAVVGKVRGEGRERFVVTYVDDASTRPVISKNESITFSLSDWRGNTEPRKEQVVLLYGVQLFAKGWRATSACPITLEPQAARKD